jgi:UDP-N-acetylmuramyl pentapeptide phosphotransferase/UDP-N-acetylglucosamine-1-phosphate transferase
LSASHSQEISQFYPLAVLSYPIFEVLFSMYRKKILRDMSPMLPDSFHFHMLINKRLTKNNPKTSLFIWKRVAPFIFLATVFYQNDLVLIGLCLGFALMYLRLYTNIVRFKN